MERPLALVVDGDDEMRARLLEALSASGVELLAAATESEALELLRKRPVRVLLAASAPWSPGRGDFLEKATRLRPSVATVALLGSPSPADEAAAFASGAFALLGRPPDPARLPLVIERALARHDLLEERRRLLEQVRSREGYERILGRSEAIERLRNGLHGLAAGDVRVLFTGETGTGKRLAARVLHTLSPRAAGPFAQVECASPSEGALEADLFGWERGAVPGREKTGAGALESAAGGTVLLNDVDALPERLQDRLLVALRDGVFARVGGTEKVATKVRVLAATKSDAASLVSDRRLRDGLRRALAGATVALPSLRERREDVAPLARHFVEEIRSINDLPPIQIAPDTLETLARNAWPGNVRDLRDAIEQAVIVCTDGTIHPRDLPEDVRRGASPAAGDEGRAARFREAKRHVVESFEKRYLEDLLARHRGNVTVAASNAGMLRSALQRLLRKYELRSSDFRRGRGERTLS